MTTADLDIPATDRRSRSVTRRLLTQELRLVARDPFTLAFTLAFPIVAMLIVGGAFGSETAHGFPLNPSHWYIASYFTVMIGATGLVLLPVHIASYRERGVLRRFVAAGFPRWSFALAELCLGLIAITIAGIALLLVAAPVYGIPPVQDPLRVAAGMVVGSLAFVGIGVFLGTLLPSARAAQAVGLLLYFPSLLLGVGGPPPFVMPPGLRSIAEHLPLALVNQSIRDPWLRLGNGTSALLIVTVIAVIAIVLASWRSRL
ncbi:ABC transporter permease [Aeromicrobium sp. YIM 150415]|uniref:ABC transporter permease n=1 Tax=Aeromicrobium sp. YIM 150415 TaxID=2803912 RepID=UPI001965263B|nr:ABC transporter permease [Aeromicrobium sp. YIM 150415]MBM9465373.1 ABC transporter permease [Aeromicrobium sp. YIM 150415]